LGSSPYGEPRSRSPRFLPPDPTVEPPHRLTPGLALRVGVIGAVVLAAFAVLFVRLWSLQVLSGERYLGRAQANQERLIRLDAPRGRILDSKGRVLVDNTVGTAVKLWVGDLPARRRYAVVERLANLLSVSPVDLAKEVDRRLKSDPLTPITVKTAVHEEQVWYLSEHQADFPGVRIQSTYLRVYPRGNIAAQILGYVGEISADDLAAKRKQGLGSKYAAGDDVGVSGVERTYDRFLHGGAGEAQVLVDSLGNQQGPPQMRSQPTAGQALKLTIDLKLQTAAEQGLRDGIAIAHANKSWNANGGALVALDPATGAVLAMASTPTYSPSVWVGRKDPKKLAPLLDDAVAKRENFPALNRVTQVEYPPGSTWKPVTALAAMQEHLLSPFESIPCPPFSFYGRDRQRFRNWDPFVNHPMQLEEAMARSCDTYFYEVGNRFYEGGDATRVRLQQWAAKFGFGTPTGIDIGGDASGLLPTPAWRKKHYEGAWDQAWNPGDSLQLAIGQKDVTVTPLQMARFYAMIANGGKLVTPYIVEQAETPRGKGQAPVVNSRFTPDPPRETGVDPAALQIIRDSLFKATHLDYGTSSGVFGAFPVAISGKTGTAEKVVNIDGYPAGHLEDQAWWCGYGPSGLGDVPRIVVCAVIENGGHGGVAAAPAAMRVFEAYFGVRAPAVRTVNSD
jgi:penicillin-binding protein 2